MTLLGSITLFFVMLALAAMPSASVALVVTRSATHGLRNGAAAAAGIVLGDLAFVSLALLGMSALAESMGALFAIFKYAGGLYLIWLGIGLLRAKGSVILQKDEARKSTTAMSLLAGLALTLGDLKAILFYASLFPTFVDLADLTAASVVAIMATTILTVGGVKLAYAFAARSIVKRLQTLGSQKRARSAAGGLMVGTGAYLLAKG